MDLFGAGECETHLAGFGQEPCVDPPRDVGPVVLGNHRGISLKDLLELRLDFGQLSPVGISDALPPHNMCECRCGNCPGTDCGELASP